MPTLPLTENKTLPKVVILTPQQVEELDRLKINYAVMPVKNIEQEAKTAMQLEIQRYHRAIEAYNADLLTMLEGMKMNINQVHKFFSCRVSSDRKCPKCKSINCEAYVYAGGMTNGYNEAIQAVIDKVKGK